MRKICFIFLLFITASSCVAKEETEGYNKMSIEEPDEKMDIIEKALAAEEEIQSMKSITILSQHISGDAIDEETTMQVDNNIMFDPLSSIIHVLTTTLGQEVEFAMYSNEDATYFTDNPNTENEAWQTLPDTDHEEIITDYKSPPSFINYDILRENIDELSMKVVDDDDIAYYELAFNGDSNIYHQLLSQNNIIDAAEEQASVDDFTLTVKLEKDTGHLIEFVTEMYGTMDFEGDDINLFETMTYYVEGINIFEDEDEFILVPNGLQEYIDGNKE
ncbi:DUF6612 family protein [Virgibacillus kimchii]